MKLTRSIDEIWHFLSDNRNAKGWSVVFNHISPLANSTVPEGQIGALRRCHRNEDNSGVFWDERTLTAEPYKYSSLRIFNISNTS